MSKRERPSSEELISKLAAATAAMQGAGAETGSATAFPAAEQGARAHLVQVIKSLPVSAVCSRTALANFKAQHLAMMGLKNGEQQQQAAEQRRAAARGREGGGHL